MTTSLQIAVVGATGLVGQAVLELIAERRLPLGRVFAVDTDEHDGATVSFGNLELDVHLLSGFDFSSVSLAVFAAGSEVAREFVPQARAAGVAVVDFSAAFRHDDQVPLLAPGIEAPGMDNLGDAPLVSVPNCTVTPLAQALSPLRDLGIQRVSVATYQSVSGSGNVAMEELANQAMALFGQREAEVKVFAKRIAFNVLPQIGELDEEGVSEEERSLMNELPRVLNLPGLAVEASCVRVPVFFGHGWAVSVELEHDVDLTQVGLRLRAAGLQLVGADQHDGYVTPMEATGNAAVWISRLRRQGRVLSFWLAADNVKAGAAFACVKAAEMLLAQSGLH